MSSSASAAFIELQRCGVPVDLVVDVGVNTGTHVLIASFPNTHHLLFEPVVDFNRAISQAYNKLSYEVLNVALSSFTGEGFLTTSSIHGSGPVTHSQLTAERVRGGAEVAIAVRRLDSFDDELPWNFLLKIDVDGSDLRVLEGAEKSIRKASIIMIESTIGRLAETITALERAGFWVFSLVDLIHYGPSLYQLDVIAVRQDLKSDVLAPAIHPFHRSLWNAR